MLFRKKIPRSCHYCAHGTRLEGNQVLCVKRGVVERENGCRKYTYDPCKRIPLKPVSIDFEKYEQDDFSL